MKTLKISAPFISSPLNYICNKSVISGIFPNHLKYFTVEPMFKRVTRHGVPRESTLGLLLFLLCVNDLPKSINYNAEIVLFVNDTSTIITSHNPIKFKNNINKMFQDMHRWFNTNLLSLNVDKTQFMQFVTKTSSLLDLNIMNGNKKIVNICNTQFIELTLRYTTLGPCLICIIHHLICQSFRRELIMRGLWCLTACLF
jgi:hypothetical protein